MAKICEWTEEQQQCWDDWVAERPLVVQELYQSHPPDRLYPLTTNGLSSGGGYGPSQ